MMNLTSIDLYSNNEFVFRFDLDSEGDSPLILNDITGLEADTITPRYLSEAANGDRYYDLTIPPRVITLQMIMNPNFEIGESVQEIRDTLYKAIAKSQTGLVELRLNDNSTCFAHIYGFITKFNSPRLAKTIAATLEIKATTELIAPTLTTVTVNDVYTVITDSVSNAPHGCVITASLLDPCPEIRLTPGVKDSSVAPEENTGWYFVLQMQFLDEDILTISSVTDDKYVTITRGGIVYHIADVIYPGSTWPLIYPGANELSFSTFVGGTDINACEIDTVKYYHSFWGV